MSRLKLKVNNCLLNKKEFFKLFNSIFNKIGYNSFINFQDYSNIKILKYLSFEILYIFFNFQIFKFFETWTWNFYLENFDPLPMVYRPLYPWNFDTPLTHDISTPLPMVFWPPYPWNIEPPIHYISTPLPMVYWTPYPWYIDPTTHRISTPYTWYFDLPAYLLIRNEGGQNTMGVQFTIQGGGSVFNKGGQYTMDQNWPQGQNTIWHRFKFCFTKKN
jgi:hypothetical protein